MVEFETWLYRAVIAAAFAVIWFFLKRLLSEIKEMNNVLRTISEKGIIHDGKLEIMELKVDSHDKKLCDHETRIRDLKHNQDTCKYCDEQ